MWLKLSSYLKGQTFALEGQRQPSKEKQEYFLKSLPETIPHWVGRTSSLPSLCPVWIYKRTQHRVPKKRWELTASGNRKEPRKENKASVNNFKNLDSKLLTLVTIGPWWSEKRLWLSCYGTPPANAGDTRDAGSIPGLGRSLGKGMATHSSILAWRISDRGVWWATVYGDAKSRTWLSY